MSEIIAMVGIANAFVTRNAWDYVKSGPPKACWAALTHGLEAKCGNDPRPSRNGCYRTDG